MTSVIRSMRLEEEPRVLVRTPPRERGRNNADLKEGEYPDTSRYAVEAPIAPGEGGADQPDGPPLYSYDHETSAASEGQVATGVMSYEEYQVRFQEELDAMRAEARQEAHAQAYSAGMDEGRRAGEAEFGDRVQKLEALLASSKAALEQGFDGLADSAIEIVFESVCKILGTQFTNGAGIEAVVREVIRQAKERSKLVVRLSPRDYELFSDCLSELLDGLNAGQVELVADELVELGGCVLETPSGSLDGRLEIQMQRFRETLLNARQKWHEQGD